MHCRTQCWNNSMLKTITAPHSLVALKNETAEAILVQNECGLASEEFIFITGGYMHRSRNVGAQQEATCPHNFHVTNREQ